MRHFFLITIFIARNAYTLVSTPPKGIICRNKNDALNGFSRCSKCSEAIREVRKSEKKEKSRVGINERTDPSSKYNNKS